MVLASIATASGIDAGLVEAAFSPAAAATIRAQAAGTRQLGIQGVPHFKIGGRALHGAQDPQAFVAALTA
jgi:predicted DsbA family dithiol-disulfide isomerase